MAKTYVKDNDKGYKKLISQAAKLKHKPYVKVGIQGSDAGEPKKVRNDDGSISTVTDISVVEIANFHEFGLGVPERSFLRDTLDINRNKYNAIAKEMKTEIALGKMSNEKALSVIGEKIKADCQVRISDGIPPPLSDETIKNKTVNGRTGKTPLIDTGQLRQSITYVVEASK